MLSPRLPPSGCRLYPPRAARPFGLVVRGPAPRLLARATSEGGSDAEASPELPGSLQSAQGTEDVHWQWSQWSGWPALLYLAAQQCDRVHAQQPDSDAQGEHLSSAALQAPGGQPAKRQVRALSQTDWEWLKEFAERAEECLLLAELMEEDFHPTLGLQLHMPKFRRLVELGAECRQLAEEIRAALAQTADQCPAALWERTYELAAQVDQEAGIHKELQPDEDEIKRIIHTLNVCLQLAEERHSQSPSRTCTAELCRLRTLTAEFKQQVEEIFLHKQTSGRFNVAKLVKHARLAEMVVQSFEELWRQCADGNAASDTSADDSMPALPLGSCSWPPAQALEPGSADAQALGPTNAALTWMAVAMGHEAAAEAAEKRAAAQSTSAVAERAQAERAWQAALDALEAVAQAHPEAKVVKDAAAMVRMARDIKHQRDGLQG